MDPRYFGQKIQELHQDYYFGDVMSFLEHIESSFLDAETFLEESEEMLVAKGYDQQTLKEAIDYIKKAGAYISTMREKLPTILDKQEDVIIKALESARKTRQAALQVNGSDGHEGNA